MEWHIGFTEDENMGWQAMKFNTPTTNDPHDLFLEGDHDSAAPV